MENVHYTVAIADDDYDSRVTIEKLFKQDERFELVGIAKNGSEAKKIIIDMKPDIMVLDIVLSEADGYMVMQTAIDNHIRTKFMIVSSLATDTFIQKALRLGAGYFMLKPIDRQSLVQRAVDVVSNVQVEQTQHSKPKKVLEEKITNIFITVGIPAHIKGYYFLREAVKMAVENPSVINSITKTLYPSIARRFETSASKVERAIRHAIEVAWNRGKIDKINTIFGIDIYLNNEKPTNGEFIALVADKMLLEASM